MIMSGHTDLYICDTDFASVSSICLLDFRTVWYVSSICLLDFRTV